MREALQKRTRPILVGGLIVTFFIWWQFSAPDALRLPLERLEALAYDIRLNISLPEKTIDPRIVIIDIDEKSLEEVGHWPWPRDQIAKLLDNLYQQGVAVVGFDMVFPEAERNSADDVIDTLKSNPANQEIIRTLQANRSKLDNNHRFADALRDRDVVLGFVYDYRKGDSVGLLPEPPAINDLASAKQALSIGATNYTANIPLLQQATPFGGFFSLVPDRDGVIRRAPMLIRIGENIYPSLSTEVLRVYQLIDEIEVSTAKIGARTVMESIALGQMHIPTNSAGHAIVPYKGGWKSFPYIPAADVLNGHTSTEQLAGTIALIGTSAHGLFDLRSTPVQSIYPGVEVHANLIAGALDNRFPSRPEWADGVEYLIVLTIGVLSALLQPFLSPLRLIIASFMTAAALIGFNYWVWVESLFILNIALPIIMILAVSTFNLAYGFVTEAQARGELKGMFGQYVPRELVQKMSDHPEAANSFEGESREMSVMFCDIRSFTTVSESLDAAQLKQLLNRFFSPMTQIIFEHHGTIDKYVGDMIMAFWGAPIHDDKHALHAVQSSLAMLRKVKQMEEEFIKEGLPALKIGVGVNSGNMNVGDMGSKYRRSYTVLGDAVNQGSRMESLTKFYGVSFIIGESTYQQLHGAIPCREIDLVRVKGKKESVRLYEPLEEGAPVLQNLERYHQALQAYRQQSWPQAEQLFRELNDETPHRLYQLYLSRCANYLKKPPEEDWDGVFDHQQKSGGS